MFVLMYRYLGPYKIEDSLGNGVYKLSNPSTGHVLKKCVNGCRLKVYHSVKPLKLPNFHNSMYQVYLRYVFFQFFDMIPLILDWIT